MALCFFKYAFLNSPYTRHPPPPSCHQNVEVSTFSEHIPGRMFLLFLLRRVVVRLVPGMSLSQKGKCQGTHPFVGFLIQSAHRQQYSRLDTSSTSYPKTYLTSKIIPGCCTPDDMGVTELLPNLPALLFILLGRPGMALDAFLHWPQLQLKP